MRWYAFDCCPLFEVLVIVPKDSTCSSTAYAGRDLVRERITKPNTFWQKKNADPARREKRMSSQNASRQTFLVHKFGGGWPTGQPLKSYFLPASAASTDDVPISSSRVPVPTLVSLSISSSAACKILLWPSSLMLPSSRSPELPVSFILLT